MNNIQIITALGLSNYCWMATSSGPDNYPYPLMTFDLGNGHHLYLVDYVGFSNGIGRTVIRVFSVSVDNETWKSQDDSTNQLPIM